MDFYLKFNQNLKFNMHGLLFKIYYALHHSPPAPQVNHESHQLISQESFA